MIQLGQLAGEIKKSWGVGTDAGQMPAQVLAYIGDALYELIVRARLIARGPATAGVLHKTVVSVVRAESQAQLLTSITPLLTEEEKLVVRRGRNVQPHRTRKGAGKEFTASTGLEALLGYLLVKEDFSRIAELLDPGEEDNLFGPLKS